MTFDRPTTIPPRPAEWLLRLMLASQDRDTISGDLLEEYRQSIVPALGAGANRWYLRQVARYVVGETGAWAAIVAALLVGRFVLDTLVPVQYTPGVIAPRSAIMSQALVTAFVLCGAWHAWRTGRFRNGFLIAVAVAWIAGVLTFVGTLACLAIWHDPAAMRAIERSGGIDEATWGMPILLTMAGTSFGFFGAVAGRLAVAIYGASRPKTKSA